MKFYDCGGKFDRDERVDSIGPAPLFFGILPEQRFNSIWKTDLDVGPWTSVFAGVAIMGTACLY